MYGHAKLAHLAVNKRVRCREGRAISRHRRAMPCQSGAPLRERLIAQTTSRINCVKQRDADTRLLSRPQHCSGRGHRVFVALTRWLMVHIMELSHRRVAPASGTRCSIHEPPPPAVPDRACWPPRTFVHATSRTGRWRVAGLHATAKAVAGRRESSHVGKSHRQRHRVACERTWRRGHLGREIPTPQPVTFGSLPRHTHRVQSLLHLVAAYSHSPGCSTFSSVTVASGGMSYEASF